MFVCEECGHIFEDTKHYVEKHNLDYGPYEEWDGCPICSGNYVEAHKCDCCDEWIVEAYVKVEDQRYCQECYQVYGIGDE